MSDFWESYVGQLRKLVGNRKIIVPSASAVIQDKQGHFLFIQRRDNSRWAFPAGTIELGESILDCLKREVKEETGLDVTSATPFALYTAPKFDYINAFEQEYQLFSTAFRIDQWAGDLSQTTDETMNARFFPPDQIPDLNNIHREIFEDFKTFNGQFILK